MGAYDLSLIHREIVLFMVRLSRNLFPVWGQEGGGRGAESPIGDAARTDKIAEAQFIAST